MVQTVYALCGLTSLLCAILLIRSYLATRSRLLLWSALAFSGLAVNNLLLVVDMLVMPELDLGVWRAATGVVAVLVLVWGLIGVSVGKAPR